METVARTTFNDLDDKLKKTIINEVLQGAIEVIKYVKPAAGSTKPLAIQREIRDEDYNLINVTDLLLVNRSFAEMVPLQIAELVKAIEISNVEEARKLRILLTIRRSPLLNQITHTILHLQPGTYSLISPLADDINYLKTEFSGLYKIALHHPEVLRIPAGQEGQLFINILVHFSTPLNTNLVFLNTLLDWAASRRIILVYSAIVEVVSGPAVVWRKLLRVGR